MLPVRGARSELGSFGSSRSLMLAMVVISNVVYSPVA